MLNLSFPIQTAIFGTPKERHEYGELIARHLQTTLKIMGTHTIVMFNICDPKGNVEGPDE